MAGIKILALGDSLTVGLQSQYGPPYYGEWIPYPRHLERLAQEHLKSLGRDVKMQVMNKGISGDLTSDMLERFSRDVIEQQPSHVVTIGGTNDIGWNVAVDQIFQNLKSMYDLAEDHAIMPVACSIPSILGFDYMIASRVSLNRMIGEEAERRGIPFVDLFDATAESKTRRLSQRYSGDGIHLNTEGYRRIAETIFNEWLRRVLDQYVRGPPALPSS